MTEINAIIDAEIGSGGFSIERKRTVTATCDGEIDVTQAGHARVTITPLDEDKPVEVGSTFKVRDISFVSVTEGRVTAAAKLEPDDATDLRGEISGIPEMKTRKSERL